MQKTQSELTVITKAKDLCSYIVTVTQKSPKQFRFTFTSRLQNLSLNVIENLYRANDTFVTKENLAAREKRLAFQHQAMTDLKLLCYFSLLAREQNCILPKQYEQISRQSTDSQNLLGAWMIWNVADLLRGPFKPHEYGLVILPMRRYVCCPNSGRSRRWKSTWTCRSWI